MQFYPGVWNGVSGFLDDHQSLEEKVREELREELGIAAEEIERIQSGEVFDQEGSAYDKTWIVHPVLIHVKTDRVRLDWEAHSHRWVSLEEARTLPLMPGFDRVLDAVERLLEA